MSGLVDHLLTTPEWVVLLAVFALPALESSMFLGFVFPGETAVLLGGVAAAEGHAPLAAVIAAGVGGAILGDAVGFVLGRRWGRRILDSTVGRFVKRSHVERAEAALRRRGGLAVFVGRFTATLRVLVPGLAGMAGMRPRRFLTANAAGGVVWGTLVAVAGYAAGTSWQRVAHDLTGAGLLLTGVVVGAIVVAYVTRRLVHRPRPHRGPGRARGDRGAGRCGARAVASLHGVRWRLDRRQHSGT